MKEPLSFLETPIEYLKGVGPQRAEMLKKELGIYTYSDLLTFYPFRYADRTKFYKIREINADLPYVQLRGKLSNVGIVGTKRGKRLVAYLKDETGSIELVWFQGIKWIYEKLAVGILSEKPGTEFIVFGKPTVYSGRFNIAHPEIDEISEENTKPASALQPVYNTTEKLKAKGLDSKGIHRLQKTLLVYTHSKIHETLPGKIINVLKFISKEEAFRNIHLPESPEKLKKAELRLKFEELFFIQLRLLKIKAVRQKTLAGFAFATVGNYFNDFYSTHLPFELTNAQKRVIKEIRRDTGSGKQMNRLLQGDVGSGKTLVAVMTLLIALDNGFQGCLMAPTEILANQHLETLSALLTKMNITIALLTGSTKIRERRVLHEQLQSGKINILIGTHALLEDEVKFRNLGMVIIDEQHRFGVAQRAKMWTKTSPDEGLRKLPHILVMTATPIPRTLAMTLYGDLDVSVIDEMPPGRKPITTVHRYDSQRLRVFGFMKEQIQLGRQIYVVYPLIEESAKLDLKNLIEGYESISKAFPLPGYKISIVHGQMKTADKDFEMQRFVKGETQIMVATTVIEVGVNVPNASVMIIENAERFGLSQLHQLRGRVGRGADQSYCILMTSFKIGADAKIRLDTMVRTNDGFEIAEVDLRIRGPGDIAGTQQSGVADLRIADLAKDAHILKLARDSASQVLSEDPNLESHENNAMAKQLAILNKNRPNWSRIS